MSRQKKEIRFLWWSTILVSTFLLFLVIMLMMDHYQDAEAKTENEPQVMELQIETFTNNEPRTMATPIPEGRFIATGQNPTPTPTNTPIPPPTCSLNQNSGTESGVGYFMCEGVGLRSFNARYTISYYKCNDGTVEFRRSNSASAIITPNGPEPVQSQSAQFTLRTSGSHTSWFGPSYIPYCSQGGYVPPGSYNLCGSPSNDAWGPLPSESFFDSITIVLYVEQYICPAPSIGLDKVLSI